MYFDYDVSLSKVDCGPGSEQTDLQATHFCLGDLFSQQPISHEECNPTSSSPPHQKSEFCLSPSQLAALITGSRPFPSQTDDFLRHRWKAVDAELMHFQWIQFCWVQERGIFEDYNGLRSDLNIRNFCLAVHFPWGVSHYRGVGWVIYPQLIHYSQPRRDIIYQFCIGSY